MNITQFWQKYQVLIAGVLSAVAIDLQQYLGAAAVDWKVIGFSLLLAIASWAGNNLRGKGVSVMGVIGVTGYAIATTAVSGSINWNQLIIAFVINLIALTAPPPKTEAYEQSAPIVAAKAEAKQIDKDEATKK